MGLRGIMTELFLPRRVAKIVEDGIVFFIWEKIVSSDFSGAANTWCSASSQDARVRPASLAPNT